MTGSGAFTIQHGCGASPAQRYNQPALSESLHQVAVAGVLLNEGS